jgi:serine/threonine protein kinase
MEVDEGGAGAVASGGGAGGGEGRDGASFGSRGAAASAAAAAVGVASAELPQLPEEEVGVLHLPSPGPGLPGVDYLPVVTSVARIGDKEVLVWECEAQRSLWGFVKKSRGCQMGCVRVVGRCRRKEDGRVRFVSKPDYEFAALKAQSKSKVEEGDVERLAGRGGDDTVLEKAMLLALRRSPHVARLLGVWHDAENVYTLMEYLRGGELTDAINRSPGVRLSEGETRAIIAQVLLGLSALHDDVGYAHCDLSPENVLFALDPNGGGGGVWTARIIDFGAAKLLRWRHPSSSASSTSSTSSTSSSSSAASSSSSSAPSSTRFGPCPPAEEGWEEEWSEACARPFGKPAYMAPEYYQRGRHRLRQLDLWAVGVCAFVMLAGEYLYDRPVPADPGFAPIHAGHPEVVVERLRRRMREAHHGDPTRDCVDFIVGLLDPDPAARPASVQQLLRHRWIYDAAVRAHEAAAHFRRKDFEEDSVLDAE